MKRRQLIFTIYWNVNKSSINNFHVSAQPKYVHIHYQHHHVNMLLYVYNNFWLRYLVSFTGKILNKRFSIKQCFGSGSTWIRIDLASWIQIHTVPYCFGFPWSKSVLDIRIKIRIQESWKWRPIIKKYRTKFTNDLCNVSNPYTGIL